MHSQNLALSALLHVLLLASGAKRAVLLKNGMVLPHCIYLVCPCRTEKLCCGLCGGRQTMHSRSQQHEGVHSSAQYYQDSAGLCSRMAMQHYQAGRIPATLLA